MVPKLDLIKKSRQSEEQGLEKITRYITARYILALSIMALLFISAFVSVILMLRHQTEDVSIMVRVSDMKLSTERILNLAEHLEDHADVEEYTKHRNELLQHHTLLLLDYDLLRAHMEGLQFADSEAAIFDRPPYELDKHVQRLYAAIEHIKTNPHHLIKPALGEIIALREPLMRGLTAVLDYHMQEVHSEGGDIQQFLLMTLVVLLGVIALEVAIIFRPIVRQVVEAQRRVNHANRAKGDFLANMSHEIRTPLNGIIGASEILLHGDLSAKERERVKAILLSAESLLDIINDILDFSKIESGNVMIESYRFNLREQIYDVVRLLRTRARDKHLELIVDYPLDLPQEMIGDGQRIRQVLINLLGNAIKFTDQGSVAIAVHLQQCLDKTHSLITFSIQDTGIGIPEDKIPHLFQKFSQLDTSWTRKHGGTGLGLAICKEFVVRMGGDIHVQTVLGKGSVFTVTLPLEHPELEHPKRDNTLEKNERLKGKRILVVDDTTASLEWVASRVRAAGALCQMAGSADEAVGVVTRQKMDAVLIDYMMPQKDGGETDGIHLARQLLSQGLVDNIPMIVMSSLGEEGYASIFYNAGFTAVLSKPCEEEVLWQTILSAMEVSTKGAALGLIANHDTKARVQKRPVKTRSAERVIANPSATVLLVEDNPVNQSITEEMLNLIGLKTLTAENGKIAVDMLKKRADIDVILMDCQMPEMDGFQATQAIRSMRKKSFRQPVIIALTANALRGDRERCIESGMDDYLAKPIRQHDLQEKIEQWLEVKKGTSVKKAKVKKGRAAKTKTKKR